jgi:hypothetical protein
LGASRNGYEAKGQAIGQRGARIASLEEELACLQRGKKKKAVTNRNKGFIRVVERLAAGEAIPEKAEKEKEPVMAESDSEEDGEIASEIEVAPSPPSPARFGRAIKKTPL